MVRNRERFVRSCPSPTASCRLPTLHYSLSTTTMSSATSQRPLSVWELTSQLKDILEGAFPAVWVTGEISNFSRSHSGHCYLTLKDDRAQLRAVMWRGVAVRTRFDLYDGLEVICHGHLDVYAARGSYQLVIADVVPRGMGALELALRQLRERLAREGLFDAARKRPLPAFVRRIAVVTSPTGAAIHDFLQVLGRRWRGADVLIVPVRVQGEGAAAEIAATIGLSTDFQKKVSETFYAKHAKGHCGKRFLTPFSAPIASSSPVAAAAWKTSGLSTKKPWSERLSPRGFR